MDLLHALFIIGIGIISGFLNTVAGGGSLVTLPVLIFMGLPSVEANATNRVAILSQNIFAVRGFQSKGLRLPMPYVVYLSIASLAGGLIGALLAVDIDDKVFNRILSVIMVMVVILITSNRGKSSVVSEERLYTSHQVAGTMAFFILGVYGGFIQAGIGFLVIAALTLINRFSLVKTNYIKVFVALLYTMVAVIVFAVAGKINWLVGLILAIGQGLGGWVASRWSVDKGDVWIKRILVLAVIGLAIKLWLFD